MLAAYRLPWSNPSHIRCLCRTFASTGRNLVLESKKAVVPNDKPSTNVDSLQPLNRPLGVKQRPTTVERSRTEKLKDLLDQEARMAQRRHLYVPSTFDRHISLPLTVRVKEAGKGYFHDMNMTRRHGGKTWIAPKVLIKEDVCYFLRQIVASAYYCNRKPFFCRIYMGKV